jgi:hypothetical protein
MSIGHALAGETELALAAIAEAGAPQSAEARDALRLGALALTHLARGDPALALAHADAAVEGAAFRVQEEGYYRLLRAQARIRAEGASGAAPARDDLDRAEACFAEQGAVGHAGRISETRAELAAALGDEPARLAQLRAPRAASRARCVG